MISTVPMNANIWFPGVIRPRGHVLMSGFSVSYPKSRGRLTLASPDPLAPPRFSYNLLSTRDDLDDLRQAYKIARDLFRQQALARHVDRMVRPHDEPRTDEEIDAYLRASAATTHHPVGSCRMGIDANAVVDAQARVNGIAGLRVADASIFPTQIGGNPTSPVMMAGDKIADFILGAHRRSV
jgi:choline dehydrogenase